LPNVAGAWVQNEEVKGSLMMRPHGAYAPFVESTIPGALRILSKPSGRLPDSRRSLEEIRVFDLFEEIFCIRGLTSKGEIVTMTAIRYLRTLM
jgi:hypothetical protein